MTTKVLVIGLLAGAVIAYLAIRQGSNESPEQGDQEEAGLGIPTGQPKGTDIGTIIRTHYVFGGRTLQWWDHTLNELHAREDQEGKDLYALVRKRAEANLLTVDDGGQTIKVEPTPELLKQIDQRIMAP